MTSTRKPETLDPKVVDQFLEFAVLEADRIAREFSGYLRLYEVGDLISWAFLDGRWKDYLENPGAMRVIIRFSMLRSLAKAQDFSHCRVELPQQEMINYDSMPNRNAVDPVEANIYREIIEIINETGPFSKGERKILLESIQEDKSFPTLAEEMELSAFQVRRQYSVSMGKLRKILDG